MSARIEYQPGDRIPGTRLCYQSEAPRVHPKRRRAYFKCDCGSHFDTDLNWVRFRTISSCGCLKSELVTNKNTKHSQAVRGKQTGAYRSWQAMHQRAASHPDYKNRPVCARWSGDDGFDNFFADMGPRPKGLTIERIDNNLGYFPANCKWATYSEQGYNTSRSRKNKHV